MNKIFDIDKVFCITKFNNERLLNIIEQKNKLDLKIEFIYPEYNDIPFISLKQTFQKILFENKNKYKKILILEDDFWTDLSYNEILCYVKDSGYNDIEFDVFTLGSPIFEIENFYKKTIKINSFGYAHSLIINLENITEEFIQELNDMNEPLDIALSRMSNNGFNVYGFNQAIFQQKNNFKSDISPDKDPENFNPVFRHLRNKKINTNHIVKISEQDIFFESKTNAWSYYTNNIIKRKIDFQYINNTDLKIKIYDYYSGAYTHDFDISWKNFWIEFDLITPKVVLEIKDINNNIIYNEIILRKQ